VEVRKKQRESAFTIKCEKRLNPNHWTERSNTERESVSLLNSENG
jgi:hypothetical protein